MLGMAGVRSRCERPVRSRWISRSTRTVALWLANASSSDAGVTGSGEASREAT